MNEETYWNGEPCDAKRVEVIVGQSPRPTWWSAKFVGQKRPAVRIRYGGQQFYIDDEDGIGWDKVTSGRGSFRITHFSLPVEREVGEI